MFLKAVLKTREGTVLREDYWNIWKYRFYLLMWVAIVMIIPVYMLGSYFPLFDRNTATKISSHVPIYEGEIENLSTKVLPSIVTVYSRLEEGDSIGSGVVLREGYILTNAHVIDGSKETVVKKGDKKYRAIKLIYDIDSDIGIIKIKEKLPVAKIGSSKDLKVGQLVIAMGNPLGYSDTVTAGVVSALKRNTTIVDNNISRSYTGLIQTDADMNLGNSGGALINQKGEVVGINTLIESTNGRSQGIGFAISIDTALKVANDLIREGKTKHPYIGVEINDTNFFSAKISGALVVKVVTGSPAFKAGIKNKDIIVRFDGKRVTDIKELIAAVNSSKIGKKVNIGIYRKGKYQKLNVIPLARPK